MGTSYTDARYTINGTLNTGLPALSNLEKLANAAGTWVTYDTHEGKFAVVINRAGSAEWHFDDDNILGAINIAYTPLDKMYNTVKVNYPHEDLKGETDWVQISIPQDQRSENEFENVLIINHDVVTNPVQAELLGFIELKQSRVDMVVTFRTDYSNIGIKAGDLFDITSDLYNFEEKMFRVISVTETDNEDGAIEISVTGLEYDASVYDEDLTRYIRSDSSGIVPLASIPAPTKPTVTVADNKVQLYVDTTITGGIVDELEFWSSSDVEIADDLRSYALLRKYVPGDQIPLNQSIRIVVESANASTFVVKVRAKNSDGVSVFSLPSDVAYYQGTDIVTNGTAIVDPATNTNMLNSLGLSALLKLLNSMMGGANNGPAATGVGSLFRKMSDTLKSEDGFMVCASAGQFLNDDVPPGESTIYTTTFTAPYTGRYSGQIVIDQNTSGARGGRGSEYSEPSDTVAAFVDLLDSEGNYLASESSGGRGTWFWTDWAMSIQANLVAGQVYQIRIGAMIDTESNPSDSASITCNWNLFSIKQ